VNPKYCTVILKQTRRYCAVVHARDYLLRYARCGDVDVSLPKKSFIKLANSVELPGLRHSCLMHDYDLLMLLGP